MIGRREPVAKIHEPITLENARFEQSVAAMLDSDSSMQLADRERAAIFDCLTHAAAILAAARRNPSRAAAEVGRAVIGSTLAALDETTADVTHAAHAVQRLGLILGTLNVAARVHERVRDAFRVLGRRQELALRRVEISCLVDARYRQRSLRAELQGVRAELAGDDPCAALEPARRARSLLDEFAEQARWPRTLGLNGATTELPQIAAAGSPQDAVADLVLILGG
ncbi:MAG TPA: hypothetical protein VJS12_03385 [Steroidobacteraceae bacterium]|nr:hypothetical protein [Steroidobacteraceae bacterium]